MGTVSDPSGAVISGAEVTIKNVATGQVINVVTNSSGSFNSGALIPADYKTQVSAKGFASAEVLLTVLVGNTATVTVILRVGNKKEVVEVQDSSLRVNTEQATVQGVLNTDQIENLPVNGRNFLDLAQLEPGVQVQDGGNFGIGKDGFPAISFGGRFGRTTRIETDGIDLSDEIFGSTTTNVAASAIQEFQLSQSSQDLSTELTTSGAVNVITRSGTNTTHGEAFDFFRDSSVSAALPTSSGFSEPFNDRNMADDWAARSSKANSFIFWTRRGPCSISRRPFSWPTRSSNTRGVFLLHSARTISWRRRTISFSRECTPSIASVIFRIHWLSTAGQVIRCTQLRLSLGLMSLAPTSIPATSATVSGLAT